MKQVVETVTIHLTAEQQQVIIPNITPQLTDAQNAWLAKQTLTDKQQLKLAAYGQRTDNTGNSSALTVKSPESIAALGLTIDDLSEKQLTHLPREIVEQPYLLLELKLESGTAYTVLEIKQLIIRAINQLAKNELRYRQLPSIFPDETNAEQLTLIAYTSVLDNKDIINQIASQGRILPEISVHSQKDVPLIADEKHSAAQSQLTYYKKRIVDLQSTITVLKYEVQDLSKKKSPLEIIGKLFQAPKEKKPDSKLAEKKKELEEAEQELARLKQDLAALQDSSNVSTKDYSHTVSDKRQAYLTLIEEVFNKVNSYYQTMGKAATENSISDVIKKFSLSTESAVKIPYYVTALLLAEISSGQYLRTIGDTSRASTIDPMVRDIVIAPVVNSNTQLILATPLPEEQRFLKDLQEVFFEIAMGNGIQITKETLAQVIQAAQGQIADVSMGSSSSSSSSSSSKFNDSAQPIAVTSSWSTPAPSITAATTNYPLPSTSMPVTTESMNTKTNSSASNSSASVSLTSSSSTVTKKHEDTSTERKHIVESLVTQLVQTKAYADPQKAGEDVTLLLQMADSLRQSSEDDLSNLLQGGKKAAAILGKALQVHPQLFIPEQELLTGLQELDIPTIVRSVAPPTPATSTTATSKEPAIVTPLKATATTTSPAPSSTHSNSSSSSASKSTPVVITPLSAPSITNTLSAAPASSSYSTASILGSMGGSIGGSLQQPASSSASSTHTTAVVGNNYAATPTGANIDIKHPVGMFAYANHKSILNRVKEIQGKKAAAAQSAATVPPANTKQL